MSAPRPSTPIKLCFCYRKNSFLGNKYRPYNHIYSRVGTLIVSPVTADKLPMSPPAGGAQFGVPAWTIQPAGTRFDPPIEVTLPNASSQPAGDNLPIVQWDHDLGQYVAMGRATVSEDGAVLVCDSGSGITKAGWGGLPPPPPPKCQMTAPPKCHQCQDLVTLGDCPGCKDKEPCKPDPLEEKASAEFPKKSLIKEKLSSLIRKVPFISTLNVDIQASGEQKTGKGCCSKPSIFEKCLGPFSYEEVSGKGELSIDVGVGPSVLNWHMPDKIVYWGQDRWRATLKTEVSVAKVAAKGIAEAKTKTTACEDENCVSYSAQASAKLSLADVKLSGEVVLEEPEGRPSWNKWTVVLGGGATGTAVVNASGIKASYSYSDGAKCPSSGATEGKVEWDEVAAEIKAKVTAKVPGIIWPTGGYEWAWKYVIIEKGVF
jgi:hypothetical protein